MSTGSIIILTIVCTSLIWALALLVKYAISCVREKNCKREEELSNLQREMVSLRYKIDQIRDMLFKEKNDERSK